VRPGYWGDSNDPNIVVEPNNLGAVWVEGDYHLLRTSPYIDAGNNDCLAADYADLDGDGDMNEAVPFDLDGRPRILDGIPDGIPIVDRGAYETVTEPLTHYVDDDADGANDGSSWEDAFRHVQDALAAVIYGDEIRVGEGVYRPDCNTAVPGGTGNREASFQLVRGIVTRGGYAGVGAPDPNERNVQLYKTILSGDLNGDDGPGFTNIWENSHHIITGGDSDQSTVLDGFIISGGSAYVPGNVFGGGMYNDTGSPMVTDCIFTGNFAMSGGAVYNKSGSPMFANCSFSGNQAMGGGGAATNAGGALLVNCTVAGNTAKTGGGLYNYIHGSPTVTNCVFWDNKDENVTGATAQISVSGVEPVVRFCCIQDGDPNDANIPFGGAANNNIDDNPCFAVPGYWDAGGLWVEGDYQLLPTSPCIDVGDNNEVPADSADLDEDENTSEPAPWDLAGRPRIADGDGNGEAVVDMGCYEVPARPMQVPMKFTPGALNPYSSGRWVKAHFVLPEGFGFDDVDADRPAKLTGPFALDIQSEYMNVFVNDGGLVEVEAAFKRADFCAAGGESGAIEVRAAGWLTSGQQFYGSATVKITSNYLEHVANLASYWLRSDCDRPDWCGGVDIDRNSVVNFVDFALFDACCIEIIKE
jgi:hypothetical protein